MVQCYDCKRCAIVIPENAIICIDENLKNGFRVVSWIMAFDEEDPCSRFIRKEE